MKCPRCCVEEMVEDIAQNALSRSDNETYVCSPCGEDEAFLDYIKADGVEPWPIIRITINGHFNFVEELTAYKPERSVDEHGFTSKYET